MTSSIFGKARQRNASDATWSVLEWGVSFQAMVNIYQALGGGWRSGT